MSCLAFKSLNHRLQRLELIRLRQLERAISGSHATRVQPGLSVPRACLGWKEKHVRCLLFSSLPFLPPPIRGAKHSPAGSSLKPPKRNLRGWRDTQLLYLKALGPKIMFHKFLTSRIACYIIPRRHEWRASQWDKIHTTGQ